MTNSERILVNTAAQYTRTVINVCLSLYSTRLVLAALGQADYGIYSVVAGVVSMLSFVTSALVVTTQRYLSFNHGAGNKEKVYQVFGNSVLLHVLIALCLLLVFGGIAHPVIHHFLNIEPERLTAAMCVYFAAVVMLCLSFITAPFRALYIARENIVYISVVDVIDGVLRLLIALFLTHIAHYDKLITYSGLLTGISLFNLLAFGGYALYKFEECHLPRLREWDKEHIKDLSGFAGWTIYSTGCIVVRTQGIAVLLNRVFGTIMNAAYGIALQVSGAVHFVAQSILSAMNPQIVKAEGAGNRAQMLSLAEAASKYAYLLLSMVAIPLIAEMPAVLQFWLKEVPDNAVMFCRFVLLASLIDQLTIGLGTANQAIGRIRTYSLTVNTIKVLTLPVAWLCLHLGAPVQAVMICYVAFELLCALTRLPFLKVTAGLQISHFARRVFVPVVLPTVVVCAVSYLMITYTSFPYRFVATIVVAAGLEAVAVLLFALSQTEKQLLLKTIKTKLHKR